MVNYNNFTSKITDTTLLGFAVVLIDIEAGAGVDADCNVLGVVGTLNEAYEVIRKDFAERMLGSNGFKLDTPLSYRVQAKGVNGDYFDALCWNDEQIMAECC